MPCMAPTLPLCNDGLILAFACIDGLDSHNHATDKTSRVDWAENEWQLNLHVVFLHK